MGYRNFHQIVEYTLSFSLKIHWPSFETAQYFIILHTAVTQEDQCIKNKYPVTIYGPTIRKVIERNEK